MTVGVMGGRDYFLFRELGYDVHALDLGPQPDIETITFASIEEDPPFGDGEFDIVLVGEVLEHLKEDVRALTNISRILKPEGKLIVSVPFYNDWEEGHVRIHSPISIQRLLAMGGFTILDTVDRPAFLRAIWLNPFQHGLSMLIYLATGKTAYGFLTSLSGRIAWKLGHVAGLRPIRRLSRSYGVHILCQKGESFDSVSINRELYTAAKSHGSN